MVNNINIGVVGAGTMGTGISQVAAGKGFKVIVLDSDIQGLSRSKSNLSATLNKLVEKGKISQEQSSDIISNISYTSDINDLKDCGLVIEAIIEDVNIKKTLFAQLSEIVGKDTILATNTSSLSIASIAGAVKHPSRFIGIHFFNPVPLMKLVEIVPSVLTDRNVVKETFSLIASWDKTAVVAKDTPGFIVNRIARPYYTEAMRIYEEGIGSFATIDWAMKEYGKFRMGPFEVMDLIGNDVNYTVTETIFKEMYYDPIFKPSVVQKRLAEAGLYGRKTGRGFYDYSQEAVVDLPLKDDTIGAYIFRRIITMLINTAIDSLMYNIASAEDIDLAMTLGVNYPKGLLKWGEEIGLDTILRQMEFLYEQYNEDRYRPSAKLKSLVKTNSKIYK